MFKSFSNKFAATLQKIKKQDIISEDNISQTIDEVFSSLIDADVSYEVAENFVKEIKEQVIGEQVTTKLKPGQEFVNIVQTKLEQFLGEELASLNFEDHKTSTLMLVGLQGVGKTSTLAKLALKFKEDGKKVLLSSTDVYRPAAMDQLQTLAKKAKVQYFENPSKNPVEIASKAHKFAVKNSFDLLLLDTAGRLDVDEKLMQEVKEIEKKVNASEVLYVVDATVGQSAVEVAQNFKAILPLTGYVLTKADSDARAGAIFSLKYDTGLPIKFIASGEGIHDITPYDPKRLASSILGMGDIVSLVEKIKRETNLNEIEALAKKFKNQGIFTLADYYIQLKQVDKMGGLGSIMEKLPNMGGLASMSHLQEKQKNQMKKMKVIIESMTPKEKLQPEILNGSRKKRIAQGSGTELVDLNRLLKQHKAMQKMMKKSSGGLNKRMMNMASKMNMSDN